MQYSKGFFDLQIRFAQTVARVIDVPLERALLEYTNLYVRFGLGRAFNQDHPIWRRYIDGLSEAADICDWTYRFFAGRPKDLQPPLLVATFGCFSYARQDAECVRIHFHNREPSAVSPLSTPCLAARLAELRSLFDHVRRTERAVVRVAGTSWLYNVRAYQRCFPANYVASAKVAEFRFGNMSLWGQFLDRYGAVKVAMAEEFMQRLSGATDFHALARSFPLQALAVDAPITQFYRFYGLENAC
ncbi:hypothetical protein CUJ89_37035 [Burkholderia pyrrocinia]|uniref:Uncharacterized protein n=1 Tax=Burkholderia pyrrocinia TaxID=60550 RepID=A0A2Z5NAW5_BURPY|nr:hypothetical protein [Burkholderia pyrrocinia]AXF25988.1 hypothetical protein CUJ89_37035 [Burkholderia pyrrocinia]